MLEMIALIVIVLACLATILYQARLYARKNDLKDTLLLQTELLKERQHHFLPHKMEAYQRAILYLERIHPTSLVLRLNQAGASAKAMEALLLKAIRDEYDHNVAQQLFISNGSWTLLKSAKDETVRLVGLVGDQLNENATGHEFSSALINTTAEIKSLPSEIAIEALKSEFQKIF